MNRDAIVMLAFAAFLVGAMVGGWIVYVAKEEGEEKR